MSKKKSKKKTKRTYTAVQDIEKLLAAEPPAFSVITGAAGCHKKDRYRRSRKTEDAQ